MRTMLCSVMVILGLSAGPAVTQPTPNAGSTAQEPTGRGLQVEPLPQGPAESSPLPEQAQPQPPQPAPASEPMVTKLTPEMLSAVLREAGLQAQIGQSHRHNQIVLDVTPGRAQQFKVILYDCNRQRQCEDMTLWSWYRWSGRTEMAAINQWNAQMRWSRAYLDRDEDPVLESDINATGGIGPQAVRILVNTYLQAMSSFYQRIGGK